MSAKSNSIPAEKRTDPERERGQCCETDQIPNRQRRKRKRGEGREENGEEINYAHMVTML